MPTNNFDAFDEGIVPGGARTKNEIRTLLCYMFRSVGLPMSRDTVIKVLQLEQLVNYFEANTCFDDLINLGNLEVCDSEKGLYKLTKAGEQIAMELEMTLPVTMKKKAYRTAMNILNAQRVEEQNPVDVVKTENGYLVNCRIFDGNTDLLSVSVYAATQSQLDAVKESFHKNPECFYKTVIALLMNDRDLAKDALESIAKAESEEA